MGVKRGDIEVGKEPEPKPEPSKEPVEVSQTIDVGNLQSWMKEKFGEFEASLFSKLPGSGDVSTKFQEILDWMKKEKPETIEEVVEKVEETVSPSMLQRIPASMTFMGKPFHNLFKGKKDGEKK